MKIRWSIRSCWRLRRTLWRDGLGLIRTSSLRPCHAFCTEDYAGAALWLPPGVHPDDKELEALLQSTVAPSLVSETAAVFEQMATYHPTEPHWFLPLIGVDPPHQGEGHGEALMAYALARCDRDHAPAYLESSNPRNIPFYRRHGFEPLGAIQVGSSPTVVPMLRGPH